MPALQNRNLRCRLEEVQQANRTILVHRILDANVGRANLVWIAATTRVTVEEVLASTHSTNPTAIAMEHLFMQAIVIPEVACRTEISSEDFITHLTVFPWRLPMIAFPAHDLLDELSIDLMSPSPSAILHLVMAMTAPKEFATARSYYSTAPTIVTAAIIFYRRFAGSASTTLWSLCVSDLAPLAAVHVSLQGICRKMAGRHEYRKELQSQNN